jgi:hypothetical protein
MADEAQSYEEAQAEAAPAEPRPAEYWHTQIKEYRAEIEDKWATQRQNLDKLYSRDERADATDREYAIFWANIEVLKPATYARAPVPVVAPRFKGGDPVATKASEMLERCLVTSFEQAGLHDCMVEVRDELLRYSRGTARVRLAGNDDKLAFDFFCADDFAHGVARYWGEVPWVGFRTWPTREQGKKRFDQSLAKFGRTFDQVPVKKRDPNSAVTTKADKAPVWEIWCRDTGMVHFVSEDFDIELDTVEPWLDLTSFWPCPRPAYGTVVPKKLKPVPDIRQYKDQIEEINEITARIAALTESLRLKGFYPAGTGDLSEAIDVAMKNTDNRAILVPISTLAGLGPGGLKDNIVWLPLDQVLNLVKGLIELRRVLIEDVYQITGISDIVRGQTEASETLGAQQLKAQWGALRIRERQGELQRFAMELTRIGGETIAENFPPEMIAQMSQIKLPSQQEKQAAQMQVQQAQEQAQMQAAQAQAAGQPAPPMPEVPPEVQKMLDTPSMEEVIAFLREDRARGFAIEIETDSTIQPDEDAEKQRRIEFVGAVGTLFQQAAPIVMQAPALAPFMGETLKFVAQGFRAGRPLEGAIDQLIETMGAMAKQAMQPQEPPRDPVQEAKIETEKVKLEGTKAKTQATVVGAQADIAKTRQQAVVDQQQHAMDMEHMAAEALMPKSGQVN